MACSPSTVIAPPPTPRPRRIQFWADDQAEEVRRLIALGTSEVHWDKRPADADYVILADPEGNRFCVVDAGD